MRWLEVTWFMVFVFNDQNLNLCSPVSLAANSECLNLSVWMTELLENTNIKGILPAFQILTWFQKCKVMHWRGVGCLITMSLISLTQSQIKKMTPI